MRRNLIERLGVVMDSFHPVPIRQLLKIAQQLSHVSALEDALQTTTDQLTVYHPTLDSPARDPEHAVRGVGFGP